MEKERGWAACRLSQCRNTGNELLLLVIVFIMAHFSGSVLQGAPSPSGQCQAVIGFDWRTFVAFIIVCILFSALMWIKQSVNGLPFALYFMKMSVSREKLNKEVFHYSFLFCSSDPPASLRRLFQEVQAWEDASSACQDAVNRFRGQQGKEKRRVTSHLCLINYRLK